MDSPERRNNTGSSRIPSRLAHRARPIRQYRTDATLSRLLPPFPATPGSGCLQLHPVATTTRRWAVSHLHPTTAAPRGALPHVRDAAGEGASCIPRATVLPRPPDPPRPKRSPGRPPAALRRLSPYTPLKQPISEALHNETHPRRFTRF